MGIHDTVDVAILLLFSFFAGFLAGLAFDLRGIAGDRRVALRERRVRDRR